MDALDEDDVKKTGRLGDNPTIKLHPVRVAEYARREDARVARMHEESAPEIEVRVEYLEDVSLDSLDEGDTPSSPGSETRIASHPDDDPMLSTVPVIAVAKEDLAWYELDADAHAILALVDGDSTVEQILASVALARFDALDVIRELEAQQVIALH
jgi:hypothetical protein